MPELRTALPPYQQIAQHYRAKILRGEYAPEDKLPSARRMCEEWTISRATATRVSLELRRDGLVRATPGVGLIVQDPAEAKRQDSTATVENCERCGRRVFVLDTIR